MNEYPAAEFFKLLEKLLDSYDLMMCKAPNYSKPKTYSAAHLLKFLECVGNWTMNNHCAETREPQTGEGQRTFDQMVEQLGIEVRYETEDEYIDRMAKEHEEYQDHQRKKHWFN